MIQNIKFMIRQRRFVKIAKRLFNTEDGLLFIAELKATNLSSSPVGADKLETYHRLGEQDFVRSLVAMVEDKKVLARLEATINEEDSYE